jgi:GTP-binding protein
MKPVVALVGRPNVGKSTFFNRLVGERLAIVDDTPGTTRDRIFSDADWNGVTFTVIDTGGLDPTHGGKTPLSIGSAEFIDEIRSQAQVAIEDADVVVLMCDGETGVTAADKEVADLLRRSQKKVGDERRPPIFVAVNKCESVSRRDQAAEFYELGLGQPYAISAIHGTDTGDLLDDIIKAFPPQEEQEEDESVKIAIVGKPNAGKSSLLNRLLGKERAIVSPIAGTTRDAIDSRLDFEGVPVTLIDTAGIRRRGRIDPGVERYSVVRSFKSIERADVALLMIDAETGITAQDAHIAGYILEAWKSCVVLVNKWDAIEKDTYTMDAYSNEIRHQLNFMSYVPLLFISAKTGQRVDQVMPLALQVQEERLVRLTTSKLNNLLQKAQDVHPAPSRAGRQLKIYYATQVRSDPPTFLLFVNDPSLMHFTYARFLENRIREEYGFMGTPIRVIPKARREDD